MLSGTGLKSFQFLVINFLVTPFVRDGSLILKQDLQDLLGIFRIAGVRLMLVQRILFASGERVGRRGARIRDTQLEGMHANRSPAELGT